MFIEYSDGFTIESSAKLYFIKKVDPMEPTDLSIDKKNLLISFCFWTSILINYYFSRKRHKQ